MPVRSTRSVWVSPSSSATTISTANWRGVSPLVRASDAKMSVAHWPARWSKCIAERSEVFSSFSHLANTSYSRKTCISLKLTLASQGNFTLILQT